MEAVLSCAVMHWSLVAALSWDDIDGDFLAWRYAVCLDSECRSGLVSRLQVLSA